MYMFFFFFSSRRRHTRYIGDWSSDVCSSDLTTIDTGRSASSMRTETRPRRAVRGGTWCSQHVRLMGTPPVVETVAKTTGVRHKTAEEPCLCAGSIHEGMDRGAVGPSGTRTTHANPLNRR